MSKITERLNTLKPLKGGSPAAQTRAAQQIGSSARVPVSLVLAVVKGGDINAFDKSGKFVHREKDVRRLHSYFTGKMNKFDNEGSTVESGKLKYFCVQLGKAYVDRGTDESQNARKGPNYAFSNPNKSILNGLKKKLLNPFGRKLELAAHHSAVPAYHGAVEGAKLTKDQAVAAGRGIAKIGVAAGQGLAEAGRVVAKSTVAAGRDVVNGTVAAGRSVAEMGVAAGHGIAEAGRDAGQGLAEAGHEIAEAGRDVGHGVAEAGRGVAKAGVVTGRGIAKAGVVTGRGIATVGVVTGRGIATVGVAAGHGVATVGVAAGHGVAEAGRGVAQASLGAARGIAKATDAVGDAVDLGLHHVDKALNYALDPEMAGYTKSDVKNERGSLYRQFGPQSADHRPFREVKNDPRVKAWIQQKLTQFAIPIPDGLYTYEVHQKLFAKLEEERGPIAGAPQDHLAAVVPPAAEGSHVQSNDGAETINSIASVPVGEIVPDASQPSIGASSPGVIASVPVGEIVSDASQPSIGASSPGVTAGGRAIPSIESLASARRAHRRSWFDIGKKRALGIEKSVGELVTAIQGAKSLEELHSYATYEDLRKHFGYTKPDESRAALAIGKAFAARMGKLLAEDRHFAPGVAGNAGDGGVEQPVAPAAQALAPAHGESDVVGANAKAARFFPNLNGEPNNGLGVLVEFEKLVQEIQGVKYARKMTPETSLRFKGSVKELQALCRSYRAGFEERAVTGVDWQIQALRNDQDAIGDVQPRLDTLEKNLRTYLSDIPVFDF